MELFSLIGDSFYNKCVELALEEKPDGSHLVIQEFLQSTSNQLTYHGLFELTSQLKEEQVTVLFRNNHFSTITKHEGALYQLVTDQSFLKVDSVVWTLTCVHGDNEFVNSFFSKSQVNQSKFVEIVPEHNHCRGTV